MNVLPSSKVHYKTSSLFICSMLISFSGAISTTVNASEYISNYNLNNISSINSINNFGSSLLLMSNTTSSTNSETKVITTSEFKGDISRIENNKLYVTKDNTTKEYSINSSIAINKDTFGSSLDKLQVGDSVTVKEANNGTVISIDAISKQVFDYSKWLIPSLIIALLIIGSGLYLYRKSKTGHIQTNSFTNS